LLTFIKHNKLIAIFVHILIGYLATFGFFPTPYAYLVILISLGAVIFSTNKNEEAFLMAAYVVGVEVFLRMTKGAPLFETGKYSVMVILILGMILGPTRQKPTLAYVVYLLLLALGIALTQVPEGESLRKSIAFNLSGPVMLGVCAIYFYKRSVSMEQVYDSMFMGLLPIFSMITYMYFRTPDLKEIAFGGVSLGETSGGFGPNQVATIVGFGIYVIGFFILTKKKLSGFLIIDALFLAYFTYRGLLTFSRGGIITGGIAFVIMAFLFVSFKRDFAKLFQYIVVAGIFLLGVWLYTSDITGGMIYNRYTGRNASGIKKEDATAGRLKIVTTQLESFQNAPLLGIGVGNGKYKRELESNKVTAASHNEVTRLIEEHGLIGLIMILMLIIIPVNHFFKVNRFQRFIVVPFLVFWFLTVNHSAMRIAFPGFVYALSLLNIRYNEE
jgi:hypothetical protein